MLSALLTIIFSQSFAQYSKMIFNYSYDNGKGYFKKTGANSWGEFDVSTGKKTFTFTSIEENSSYVLLQDASRGMHVKLTNNECLWGYTLNTIDKKVHDGSWTNPIQTNSKSFRLFMRQLCCDKTTEQGADEVYILVMGQKNDGTKYFDRSPAANYHWDMNDGNQPTDNPSGDSHCITGKTLFSGDLADGQTWWLNVVIAEEDGGTSKAYQAAAAALLKAIPNPYTAAAGVVIGAMTALGFNITDSDDWMGMYGVKVTNNGGTINVEWTSKEGLVSATPDPDDRGNPAKKEFRMNHDGSNYVGWFGVY